MMDEDLKNGRRAQNLDLDIQWFPIFMVLIPAEAEDARSCGRSLT